MQELKIALAILAGLSVIAKITLIHRKRQPISPTEAVVDLLVNSVLIYALLN